MDKEIFTRQPEPAPKDTPAGPLAGINFLIQPDLCVEDWPTDAGSLALSRYQALSDSTIAAQLKASGAWISGSTQMAEFGLGIKGSTMAKALSGGYGQVGIMTDMTGEARMTAGIAGWYGFKPSWGLLSRYGLTGLIPSMECSGFIAKTPDEITRVLTQVAGPDEKDPAMSNTSVFNTRKHCEKKQPFLKIAVPRGIEKTLPESLQKQFLLSLEKISEAGFKISEHDFPEFDYFASAHQIIASVEASSCCGKYDGVRYGYRTKESRNWNQMYLDSRKQAFGPLIKEFLFQGAYFQFESYKAFEDACIVRQTLVSAMDQIFSSAGLIALPVQVPDCDPVLADTIGKIYETSCFCLPANLAGLPALGIPDFLQSDKNCCGLQIMGPRLSDTDVLNAGQTINKTILKGCRQ
jgi:aspartyl-tRNA(Asn)/glutamyl-tRNA(Gln) amidotransferase subunit A